MENAKAKVQVLSPRLQWLQKMLVGKAVKLMSIASMPNILTQQKNANITQAYVLKE